jgi:hypothetical protein
MVIDSQTYKLSDKNYYKDVYTKNQIVIGNTFRTGMLHYSSWVNRLNGKNKKTTNFTITKEGKIYQHFDTNFYSNFIGSEQDKTAISIVLENLGWLRKDSIIEKYIDWLGNHYKRNSDEVLIKKWRNHVYWDLYTKEQLNSLKELVLELCGENKISKNFIGHNTFDENIDLYDGIVFKSNYNQESTDVSPAFDMEILKEI